MGGYSALLDGCRKPAGGRALSRRLLAIVQRRLLQALRMESRREHESDALQAVCDACRRLHARNLLAAADGNISLRFSDERIAMTPAGVSKAALRPEQIAFLRLDGTLLSGDPSSERAR
jgi:Class II Aldolase and Adducin N-terminal domain